VPSKGHFANATGQPQMSPRILPQRLLTRQVLVSASFKACGVCPCDRSAHNRGIPRRLQCPLSWGSTSLKECKISALLSVARFRSQTCRPREQKIALGFTWRPPSPSARRNRSASRKELCSGSPLHRVTRNADIEKQKGLGPEPLRQSPPSLSSGPRPSRKRDLRIGRGLGPSPSRRGQIKKPRSNHTAAAPYLGDITQIEFISFIS